MSIYVTKSFVLPLMDNEEYLNNGVSTNQGSSLKFYKEYQRIKSIKQEFFK